MLDYVNIKTWGNIDFKNSIVQLVTCTTLFRQLFKNMIFLFLSTVLFLCFWITTTSCGVKIQNEENEVQFSPLLSTCNYTEKGLYRWWFLIHFAKLFRTTFFTEHFQVSESLFPLWNTCKLFFLKKTDKNKNH